MSEDDSLIDSITGAVSGVPEAIRKPFYKAFGDLLGAMVAVPTAKLEQYAQSIKDKTDFKSLISKSLSEKSVEVVCNDQDMVAMAVDACLPDYLRKAKNKRGVADRAAAHLPTMFPGEDPDDAMPPDDDWMNNFTRFAEDASSERLRDLFGRILAGQVKRPKAFSVSTLRTLSELDTDIAEDFLTAWSLSVGDSVDYSSYWQRGDGFLLWRRLSEAGLMAQNTANRFPPSFNPLFNGNGLWSPVRAENNYLVIHFKEEYQSSWEFISFTRIGREIGSILDKPDYEKNMRDMALRFSKDGLTRIDLEKQGVPQELIWNI